MPSIPDEMTVSARIFLIDDHPVVRQGLSLVLSSQGHAVCGEAGSSDEALSQLELLWHEPVDRRPQVALLDLSLGHENGQALIPTLCDRHLRVLVYSMHENGEIIEKCLDAGAEGYVSKRELGEELNRAIGQLLSGKRYLSPRAAEGLANRHSVLIGGADGAPLSERESQILAAIGDGESHQDIARSYGVSVRTVESYCARIIVKLGLDGMKALRRHAIRHQGRASLRQT